ncbi:MAG: citrate/2-methylcitrate synthase [Clostridia bacterium]|nr:citrate/2-methylcitrate synthase [Clostridia bacterium]
MKNSDYSKVTPDVVSLADKCLGNTNIDQELYTKLDVKRGLRDLDGRGVLTGLTEISTINSMKEEGGKRVPCEGELFYRGINIKDLVGGFLKEDRFGFEETIYLLLFGDLPKKEELEAFKKLLYGYRSLPTNFNRDVIMKAPNKDIMNSMARSVLTLASYDSNANDTSIPNVLRQSIQLIANFSSLAVYAYHAYRHYILNKGLYIHRPSHRLSMAENFLRMLRNDKEFTPLEAKLLDVSLVIHAEHGGGNNSTFTTHVVTSSGTDTYSSVAASLCSLKGPKHGGANIKVRTMFEDIKEHISKKRTESEIRDHLSKILNKEANDKTGLIYGMGHAVYSLSDPRAELFKDITEKLAIEKGMEDEFAFYETVERVGIELILEKRKIYKGVCTNIDFYSGLAYTMLDIPDELFTPLFAVARIAGWSAHRLEELINGSKIIRPAYQSVAEERPYIPLNKR